MPTARFYAPNRGSSNFSGVAVRWDADDIQQEITKFNRRKGRRESSIDDPRDADLADLADRAAGRAPACGRCSGGRGGQPSRAAVRFGCEFSGSPHLLLGFRRLPKRIRDTETHLMITVCVVCVQVACVVRAVYGFVHDAGVSGAAVRRTRWPPESGARQAALFAERHLAGPNDDG
jgi:hypothetical protein